MNEIIESRKNEVKGKTSTFDITLSKNETRVLNKVNKNELNEEYLVYCVPIVFTDAKFDFDILECYFDDDNPENNRKTSLITGESYLMLESFDEQAEQKKRAEGKPYQKKINFYRGGKSMVVRNIYVSDKEYFLEFLIRYLIKYGISYCLVKEADEVHFDNYIIRFHTKVNETDNLDDLLRTLMEIESNTRNFFISENENNNTDYSDKRLYPKMNKKLIKMENRKYSKMVNTKKIGFS